MIQIHGGCIYDGDSDWERVTNSVRGHPGEAIVERQLSREVITLQAENGRKDILET